MVQVFNTIPMLVSRLPHHQMTVTGKSTLPWTISRTSLLRYPHPILVMLSTTAMPPAQVQYLLATAPGLFHKARRLSQAQTRPPRMSDGMQTPGILRTRTLLLPPGRQTPLPPVLQNFAVKSKQRPQRHRVIGFPQLMVRIFNTTPM
jgi:hypothetical protein